jgi:hypothetical protein
MDREKLMPPQGAIGIFGVLNEQEETTPKSRGYFEEAIGASNR